MLAIALWIVGLAGGICAAEGIAGGWRVLLVSLGLVLTMPPWLRVLCGRGPVAVRRIRWECDGTWTVLLAGGVVERGCSLGATCRAAGPFVWLTLRGRWVHCAVLDRQVQERGAFAALGRRLQVERGSMR